MPRYSFSIPCYRQTFDAVVDAVADVLCSALSEIHAYTAPAVRSHGALLFFNEGNGSLV